MDDQNSAQSKRHKINDPPVPHELSLPNKSASSKAGELIITNGMASNPPGWKCPITNITTSTATIMVNTRTPSLVLYVVMLVIGHFHPGGLLAIPFVIIN